MGQRYAEESREPLPGDLHMVTLLRAYYSAVDPKRYRGASAHFMKRSLCAGAAIRYHPGPAIRATPADPWRS
jgi:hypothetical protein